MIVCRQKEYFGSCYKIECKFYYGIHRHLHRFRMDSSCNYLVAFLRQPRKVSVTKLSTMLHPFESWSRARKGTSENLLVFEDIQRAHGTIRNENCNVKLQRIVRDHQWVHLGISSPSFRRIHPKEAVVP